MPLPDPQDPLALLEQKEFDAAVEVLEQTVNALPAHLGARVLLAHAYEAQKHWDRALESWANVHFLMPNSPIATTGKKRVLRRMDGLETEDDRSPFTETPTPPLPGPAETTPGTPSETQTAEEEPPDKEEDSPPKDDFGLAQLRRQAEREARQGGARSGLADKSPEPPAADSPPEEPSSTPEEQVEQLEDEGETDDLDRLIDELQSARIEPDPDAATDAPPPADVSDEGGPADEPPGEEVVSETLAKIHEGQNDYQKAAHIYAQLAEQEPERTDEFRQKAAEMRKKAGDSGEDS